MIVVVVSAPGHVAVTVVEVVVAMMLAVTKIDSTAMHFVLAAARIT